MSVVRRKSVLVVVVGRESLARIKISREAAILRESLAFAEAASRYEPRRDRNRADVVDQSRLNNIFASTPIGIECEFVIVSTPLAEINRMTERHVENI